MRPDRSSASPNQALVSSVQSVIDAGRIGEPVFVRWTARITSEQNAETATGDALAVLAQLFGASPEQVHQSGGSPAYASVHARWPNGQAALVTAGPCLPGGRSGVDVMALGTAGAVYHDGQAVRRLDVAG